MDRSEQLRHGLEMINKLGRHGLLVALDRERSKSSTERLRKTARRLFHAGKIEYQDVDHAARVETDMPVSA
jgi:hypothetical protein